MKLLTAHSHSYWPLAKVTIPNKIEHAGRFGYEFVSEHHEMKNLQWERVIHWFRNLPYSKWLLFMACDVVCTNPEFDSRILMDDNYDLIIACDGNGLQSDMFIMRDCQETRDMLSELSKWNGVGTHEQDCLAFILAGIPRPRQPILPRVGDFALWDELTFTKHRKNGFWCTPEQKIIAQQEFNRSDVRVKIVDQRLLHPYPMWYYDKSHTFADWAWSPGDFAAHLVAQELPWRVEQALKLLSSTFSYPPTEIIG